MEEGMALDGVVGRDGVYGSYRIALSGLQSGWLLELFFRRDHQLMGLPEVIEPFLAFGLVRCAVEVSTGLL